MTFTWALVMFSRTLMGLCQSDGGNSMSYGDRLVITCGSCHSFDQKYAASCSLRMGGIEAGPAAAMMTGTSPDTGMRCDEAHLGGAAESACKSSVANTAESRRAGVDSVIAILGGCDCYECRKCRSVRF